MPAGDPLTRDQSTITPSVRPTGLKRRSVILMIVLTIVTFGLYYPIWFLSRRTAFNRLDSPRKLQLWPFPLFIAWIVVDFIVTVASAAAPPEQVIGVGNALILDLLQLAGAILMVVQCFFVKDILADHLAGSEDSVPDPIFVNRVELSGLMTFFFQFFYLQHVINRHIVDSQSRAV